MFDGWLGDDLVEGHACYLVTEALGHDMRQAAITGIDFADVLITESSEFKYACPGLELPRFERLVPLGAVDVVSKNAVSNWSLQDLCLSNWSSVILNEKGYPIPPSFGLVITKRCLDLIQKHNAKHCRVIPLKLVTPG